MKDWFRSLGWGFFIALVLALVAGWGYIVMQAVDEAQNRH